VPSKSNEPGSFDQATRRGRSFYPKGLDPDSAPVNIPDNSISGKEIAVDDVLSFLGADVRFSGKNWTVVSVSENSSAARSGIQTGDVIEEINGRSITGITHLGGPVVGRSLRIRRNGRPINIEFTIQ
jgi:S1-C subfamily serine protease